MKIRMQVAYENEPQNKWWENYDNDDVDDPTSWGIHTVAWFNSTLRPFEKRRVFLKAEKSEKL